MGGTGATGTEVCAIVMDANSPAGSQGTTGNSRKKTRSLRSMRAEKL